MTAYPAVSVTGHRSLTDSQMAWLGPELDRILHKLRDEHGTTDAHTGMAIGADTDFGWSALNARLKLHAHVPFPQQVAGVLAAVWDPAQRGKSGTFDTVRKAAVRGLPVIHLDVAALRTHGPGCSCVVALVEPTLF